MHSRLLAASLVTVLLSSVPAWAQPVIGTPLTDTTASEVRVFESLTVNGTTFNRADLQSGSLDNATTFDESGNFLGTYNGSLLPPLTSFDLDDVLAKNDVAGTGGSGPSDDPANPIDVINFGADVGVTSGNWVGTNGAADDFFVYEISTPTADLSNGDLIDVQAILPGGVLGNVVFLPQVISAEWFNTGIAKQGGANSGQVLYGLAINVEDLLDQNGNNLSATAELEGLRFVTPGGDLALVAATKVADPLELNVNTSTGEVTISNPNTGAITIGTNQYRITSSSGSLRNDTWNSLDDQDEPDAGPGLGWRESDGSFDPVAGSVDGDFDGDGDADGSDFLLWQRGGSPNPLDPADLSLWQSGYGSTGSGGGGDPGATNQLVELRLDGVTELGPGASLSLGTAFDVSGTQDLEFSYGTLEGLSVSAAVNYSASSAAAAVPEPSTAGLALTALVATVAARRRRRETSSARLDSSAKKFYFARSAVQMTRLFVLLLVVAWASPALGQVTLYDGSQTINIVPAADLIDGTVATTLAPNIGDGAWATGSNNGLSNVTGIGAAGSAAGVDGAFLSFDPGGFNGGGIGAAFVLRDGKQTTGLRALDFSMFYNDATPNPAGPGIPDEANTGGNVAVRVVGINENGTGSEPWDGQFDTTKGGGRSGAELATRYDPTSVTDGSNLIRRNVDGEPLGVSAGTWGSRDGEDTGEAASDTVWQDISVFFDAGTGFDWLVFAFAGSEQDGTNVPADRFGFDNIVANIGRNPLPGLTVDRDTGAVSLSNTFDPETFDITGYSITSAAGSLDATAWTPIDGRLDQSGDGSFDPDANWSTDSATATELAESADSGNGGTLGALASVGIGNAFARSPFDDLQVIFTLDGGGTVEGVVGYTGTGPIFGDLNDNGAIDEADFEIFADNHFKDLSGLTQLESYLAGDLNGDGDNDFGDFQAFRELFIEANGLAAFEAMLSGAVVPEPSTALLCLIGAAGFTARRRCRRNGA